VDREVLSNLSIGKDDFNYDPQWRGFWIDKHGFPEIGTYKFTLTSGNQIGSAKDTQSVVKAIPISMSRPILAAPDIKIILILRSVFSPSTT
jgi:hypothetical protein